MSMGFTIQTIMTSAIGLKCIALIKLSQKNDAEIDNLKTTVRNLSSQSAYFTEYIDFIGGIEQMLQDVQNQNIDAVSKWMPFAYA
jgi:hypothetical protein